MADATGTIAVDTHVVIRRRGKDSGRAELVSSHDNFLEAVKAVPEYVRKDGWNLVLHVDEDDDKHYVRGYLTRGVDNTNSDYLLFTVSLDVDVVGFVPKPFTSGPSTGTITYNPTP